MQRILYITSTRIGDAILHSGVLAHLVETYPQARFTIAAGPLAAPLFRAVPRLERVIVMAKKKRGGHWLVLWKHVAGVRWDLVVDHRGSRTSWFLRAKQRRIAGRPRQDTHKVAEAAHVLSLPPQAPRVWLDAQAEAEARGFIAPSVLASRPLLCLAPGAGAPFKIWPAERFAALAKDLTGPHGALEGAHVAILGGPGEEALARRASAGLDPMSVTLLAGPSDLLSTAALLQRCALYVGNDSGLTHLAAAVGAPTLALFGPTQEALYGPWGDHAQVVRVGQADAAARETLRHASQSMMMDLTVAQAAQAATTLIGRGEDRPRRQGGEHARYF